MTSIIETPLFSQEIPEKGATKGHTRFTIKSSSADDFALVGFCASVNATLLFERMQAQGTNIVFNVANDAAANNGVRINDVRIDVIGRFDGDSLSLAWKTKTVDPQQLEETRERIRSKTFALEGAKQKSPDERDTKKETVGALNAASVSQNPENGLRHGEEDAKKGSPEEHDLSEIEEDFLVKQLRRIP